MNAPRCPSVGIRHERRIVDVVRELGLEGAELAGAERRSRGLQILRHRHYEGIRATEDAPRDPLRGLERLHGLEVIFETGSTV